ncbi:MAG: hypothetical protein C0623_06725 [Desulfuromonas sp.]|nr:MAG: hypothetical protein C0623_06725 [Desulfuromonas sp.]
MPNFLSDIIDVASIRSLLQGLQQATGAPVSLLDHNGDVLFSSGWNRACEIYHRKHLKSSERCRDSDRFFAGYLENEGFPEDEFITHTCANGLIEVGVPIIIDDYQFATLLFGQFRPETSEFNRFREIAVEFGFDEAPYLEEIRKIPIYDEARVKKLLAVYSGIVELLSRLGRTYREEQQTRTKLKKSEEKFRELFHHSSDAIYIVDQSGQIIEVNKVACDRQGYSYEELTSMNVRELDDPLFVDKIKDQISRIREDRSYIFESAHLHKDGTSIPVEISGRIINFEGQKAIMAAARDLSERQDAMQALQRSEVKFRSIIDSSPMGIHLYYLDPEDRLIFTGANSSADAILGIAHQDLIGKTIEEAFPGVKHTEIPRRYRSICNNGEVWNNEQIDYEDKDIRGAFEIHAFQTNPKTMAVFFIDITTRKIAEQTLRESEEKYRLLFSAEKDAILIIDSKTLMVVESNNAASSMYQYTPDEFSRLKILDLSAEPQPSREQISSLLSGDLDLMEAQHKKKDGTFFPVEITAGTFEWHKRSMLVVIIRDISERDRITRLKDEMLSAISHEMRTPLTAILGFNELLLNEDVDPEKTKQFLELSHQEGERLRELIDDLLDLQRLRAGFTGENFASIQIRPMLYEIANIFREMKTGHSIEVDCPDKLPDIIANEQKINRALKNLMSNAIKYSPAGGQVKLAAKHIKSRQALALTVSDTGLGIPGDAHDQLFDRFFRVYHPEIKNIGGTGLGLALVKEIAKLHDGTISVESAPGKGSQFTLELPLSGPELDK